MKFIKFGDNDLVMPAESVVIKKNWDKQILEVYHANDLAHPIYKVDLESKGATAITHQISVMLNDVITVPD